MVSRKIRKLNFEQTLEGLRAHGFEVAPSAEVAGGVLVTKYGAGAVLEAGEEQAARIAVCSGALADGGVARLLDRGHQKFLQTPQLEIPATAGRLEAIHRFSEELKQLTGAIDLYNEALGTTSDLCLYDRVQGREAAQAVPQTPWNPAGVR